MDIKNLLNRAKTEDIRTFLLYGGELLKAEDEKSYSERIEEAEKNAISFFEKRYTDVAEFDEMCGYFFNQTSVYQEVYFEIGLLAGAKIGYQLKEKMTDLQT